jgi:hypothetical protein
LQHVSFFHVTQQWRKLIQLLTHSNIRSIHSSLNMDTHQKRLVNYLFFSADGCVNISTGISGTVFLCEWVTFSISWSNSFFDRSFNWTRAIQGWENIFWCEKIFFWNSSSSAERGRVQLTFKEKQGGGARGLALHRFFMCSSRSFSNIVLYFNR